MTRRLPGETLHLTLDLDTGKHELDVSLIYDPAQSYRLRELVFVSRGKIGQGMDLLLHDLGIKISRALQGRNPDTGDPILEPVPPSPPPPEATPIAPKPGPKFAPPESVRLGLRKET